jgi:hypothetical protein
VALALPSPSQLHSVPPLTPPAMPGLGRVETGCILKVDTYAK